jgi:hypothetical protein
MPEPCPSDEQLMHMLRCLSPEAKQYVLRELSADSALEGHPVARNPTDKEMRDLAGARGLDWDTLSQAARAQIVDELGHEA